MTKHKIAFLAGFGLVMTWGVGITRAQQSPANDSPPQATSPTNPAPTPVPLNLTIDKYGNFYQPPTIVGTAVSGEKKWQLVIREDTPPLKGKNTDRLVVFEVIDISDAVNPKTIWRTFDHYPSGVFPHPHYNGDLALTPQGQLIALIFDAQPFGVRLQLFRISQNQIFLAPEPKFDAQGQVVMASKQLPLPFYAGWRQVPEKRENLNGIEIENVSAQDLTLRFQTDSDTRPWLKSYFQGPLRFRYDFASKKWSEIQTTEAEKAKLRNDYNQKLAMEEYRRQRETMGLDKEKATQSIRFLLKDPKWTPKAEPWDTPDLKQKAPWLTPTPTPKPKPEPPPDKEQ